MRQFAIKMFWRGEERATGSFAWTGRYLTPFGITHAFHARRWNALRFDRPEIAKQALDELRALGFRGRVVKLLDNAKCHRRSRAELDAAREVERKRLEWPRP